MKHLLLITAAAVLLFAFTRPKPNTFPEDWAEFEAAWSNYGVVKANGGDTISAAAIVIEKADAVNSHGDVDENLKQVQDGHNSCEHSCLRAAVGCVRMIFNGPVCYYLYSGCLIACPGRDN